MVNREKSRTVSVFAIRNFSLPNASYCGEKAKKVATLKGNEKPGFRIEKLNGNPVNLKKNVKVIVKASFIRWGKNNLDI